MYVPVSELNAVLMRKRMERQKAIKERARAIESKRAIERKEHKKSKERVRKKEKQSLSGLHMQHDTLVIEELSTASEQQQHKASSLSPNPSPTNDPFADLQDAEASAIPPSGRIKGKRAGHKARRNKIPPSDSTQKSNVVDVHGNVQEAVRTHASPPREEESIKQNTAATLKKGCLNDAELPMGQSALRASCSSSQSGDAQEEAPFDGEETSIRLKMDNMPEQCCSRDCGKITQDEDEGGHLGKKTPAVEDEHPDEIGVYTMEDRKQEHGRTVRHEHALLDKDDHTLKEDIFYCLCQLNEPKDPFYWSEYDEPQQLTELYKRLALYRIRGYDYELSVDRKLAEMDDVTLAQHYPLPILHDEGYFEHYEEYLEWYFDPKLCKYAGFEDYQRLVLRNDGEYHDWDYYKSTLHTYEKDLAYVQYCEAIENETKWVDDMVICSIPWERVERVAFLQALKVAAGFPNVSPNLMTEGFKEHMYNVRSDFWSYKGLDGVYFEIWKRVAKQKMDFTEALSEIYQEKMFPFRSFDMEQELQNPSETWSMKAKYDAYVAVIGDLVSDDEALPLITEAVKKMSPKSKNYADYAKKKLEIAKEIRLIEYEREKNRGRSAIKGGNGEAKLEMDN